MNSSPTSVAPTKTESTKTRSRAFYWARDIVVFAILAIVVSTVAGRLRAPTIPDVAPPFSLPALDGTTVSLEDFRGKKVVLNFWATWCGPCRAEIPMVSSFARSNPDIVVLGVAVDGTPDALRAAAKKLGIDYPVIIATPAVVRQYGASTVPTTVFVDEDGSVASVHVGLITNPQLWWGTL